MYVVSGADLGLEGRKLMGLWVSSLKTIRKVTPSERGCRVPEEATPAGGTEACALFPSREEPARKAAGLGDPETPALAPITIPPPRSGLDGVQRCSCLQDVGALLFTFIYI